MNINRRTRLPAKLKRFLDTLGIADHWFGTAKWKPDTETEEPEW